MIPICLPAEQNTVKADIYNSAKNNYNLESTAKIMTNHPSTRVKVTFISIAAHRQSRYTSSGPTTHLGERLWQQQKSLPNITPVWSLSLLHVDSYHQLQTRRSTLPSF